MSGELLAVILLGVAVVLTVSGALVPRGQLTEAERWATGVMKLNAEIEADYQADQRASSDKVYRLTFPGLVTYDQVARWLSPDIVDTIAITSPCRDRPTHYAWRPFRVHTSLMTGIGQTQTRWECTHCGATSSIDPTEVLT